MKIAKYIERMKRMDDLIRRKATGNPDEFAQALGISKSMLMIYLNELKEMGAPIKFRFSDQTYFYEEDCHLLIKFEIRSVHSSLIKGGSNYFIFSEQFQ